MFTRTISYLRPSDRSLTCRRLCQVSAAVTYLNPSCRRAVDVHEPGILAARHGKKKASAVNAGRR
jgi:hypothetical protein